MRSSPFRDLDAIGSLGVPPEELVGFAELLTLLKVSRRTAAKYAKRPDFPEPLDRLASGPVWRRVDVEAWAERTLPLATGRPRSSAVVTFGFGRERPSELGYNDAAEVARWLDEQSYRDLGDRIHRAIGESTRDGDGHIELSEEERDRLYEVLNERRAGFLENSRLDFLRKGLAAEQIARTGRPQKHEGG
jgi:predicted DNA-binding transcriptional regulator AlpA